MERNETNLTNMFKLPFTKDTWRSLVATSTEAFCSRHFHYISQIQSKKMDRHRRGTEHIQALGLRIRSSVTGGMSCSIHAGLKKQRDRACREGLDTVIPSYVTGMKKKSWRRTRQVHG